MNPVAVSKLLITSPNNLSFTGVEEKVMVVVEHSPDITLTIQDDYAIEVEDIEIRISSDDPIDNLSIKIKSGKYHNKGCYTGASLFADEKALLDYGEIYPEMPEIYLECRNAISKLKVHQKIYTEHIYSYYGNQDGFDPCVIEMQYNPSLQSISSIEGKVKLLSKEDKKFSLKIK